MDTHISFTSSLFKNLSDDCKAVLLKAVNVKA